MNENTGAQKVEGQGIWTQYTMQDGLPDMKIESLFVDSQGILWIGTHDRGLVRYEGDGFTTFSRREGLVGNGVFSITEDQDGYLWLGTNRGLSRFDGKEFETIEIGGVCSLLWGSCIDWDGWLWFGLDRRPGAPAELVRWNGDKAEFVTVSDCAVPEGESIHKIVCDDEGTLWVGGENLYRQVDDDRFEMVPMPVTELGTIQDMLVWDDGSLWIAADSGVWKLKGGRWKEYHESSIHSPVSMLKEGFESYWLITYDGCLFRFENGRFNKIHQLNAFVRSGICYDQLGCLWIGSHGKGLFSYHTSRVHIFGINQGLPSDSVNCITEDEEGTLWLGTNKGLSTIDKNQIIREEPYFHNLIIHSLVIDRKKRLWINANYSFIFVQNSKDNTYNTVISHKEGISVDHLIAGIDDKIWFGSSFGKNFGYCENDKVKFINLYVSNYPPWVGSMFAGMDGSIWLGSGNPIYWDGICRYDGERFHHIDIGFEGKVLSLFESNDRNIWIGTNEGLYRFDGDEMILFSSKDGLSCEIITAILEDIDGTLWIGTEGGGIYRFDGHIFQNIKIPGRPEYNIIHCIHQDRLNNMWLGTEGGLIKYIPNCESPKIEIYQVISDKKYKVTDTLKFPNDTRRIEFHFRDDKGENSIFPMVYRYYLYGYDNKWRQVRDKFVKYHDLPPGSYIFHLQAIDCDLNYSNIVDVNFEIAEDPWIDYLASTSDIQIDDGSIGKNILVIDEDNSFANSIHSFLSNLGYVVEIAQNEQGDNFTYVKKNYEIILLSYLIAEKKGQRYLWKLKKINDESEIIFITEYKTLDCAKKMLNLGAKSYIIKPSESRVIIDQIEKIFHIKRDPLTVHIRSNIRNIHTKECVARQLKISKSTILRNVKKVTGLPFQDFMQLCRIEEAQKLIARKQYTMKEIAYKIGLTPSFFTQIFSQYTGQTPRQFSRAINI